MYKSELALALSGIEKLRVFLLSFITENRETQMSLSFHIYKFAFGKLHICIKLFMLISICLWLNGKSDRNQFNMALVVGGGGGGIYINIIS